jgi:hypothetical protein
VCEWLTGSRGSGPSPSRVLPEGRGSSCDPRCHAQAAHRTNGKKPPAPSRSHGDVGAAFACSSLYCRRDYKLPLPMEWQRAGERRSRSTLSNLSSRTQTGVGLPRGRGDSRYRSAPPHRFRSCG